MPGSRSGRLATRKVSLLGETRGNLGGKIYIYGLYPIALPRKVSKVSSFRYSFSFSSAELKMDVLREREAKDSLERQLVDERKLRGMYQGEFMFAGYFKVKILLLCLVFR